LPAKKLLFRTARVYKSRFMAPKSWRLAAAVLTGLILAAGVAYSIAIPSHARFPDEEEYLLLSGHLLHGPGYSMDGVHLTAMRPPGYPLFLAAVQALGGYMVAARVLQYVAFVLTLVLVAALVPRGEFSERLALVTVVTLLYPVQFYTTATLYPQTLSALLFTAALVLLLRSRRTFGTNILLGLVYGILLLVVPTFTLTLPVVFAVAWLLKMVRWHEALPIALGVILVVSPWIARNEIVFGKFVPFASNSGENLLIGNSENTIPYGGSGNVDRSHYEQEAQALHLDEFQTDKYYQQAAITWIKTHPGRAFILYLEKAANYFNIYNEYAAGTNAEASAWKQVAMGITYIVLMGLLAWRLVEAKRFPLGKWEILLLAVYVLTAFTMAIFVTRIRYRLPYDYLIIAIVAGHLQRRLAVKASR
jgi:hypothetical protein